MAKLESAGFFLNVGWLALGSRMSFFLVSFEASVFSGFVFFFKVSSWVFSGFGLLKALSIKCWEGIRV